MDTAHSSDMAPSGSSTAPQIEHQSDSADDEDVSAAQRMQEASAPWPKFSKQELSYIDQIKEFLVWKSVESAQETAQMRMSLRTAVPSHIKLHILDYLMRSLSFSQNIDDQAKDLIGRFVGDSDRKFLLLYRSLSMPISRMALKYFGQQKNREFIMFIFKQVRVARLLFHEFNSELVYKRILDYIATKMPQLRVIRNFYSVVPLLTSLDDKQKGVLAKVSEYLLQHRGHGLQELFLSSMSNLQRIVIFQSGSFDRKDSLYTYTFKSILGVPTEDTEFVYGLLKNRAITELSADKDVTTLASALSVPENIHLDHIRKFSWTYIDFDIGRLKAIEQLAISWHDHSVQNLAVLKSLHQLQRLNLNFITLPDSAYVSAEALLLCPKLSALQLVAVGERSHKHLHGWIYNVLVPLTRNKLLELELNLPELTTSDLTALCDRESQLRSFALLGVNKVSFRVLLKLLMHETIRIIKFSGSYIDDFLDSIADNAPAAWQISILYYVLEIIKN